MSTSVMRPPPRSLRDALREACRALLFALLASRAAAAQEWTPTRAFRVFSKSTHRGLPQSSVISLAQDVQGLLWIGTLDGAATFDGRSITPVEAAPGAPVRGVISAIVPSRSGGVAVGSSGGVHIFDGRSWAFVASSRGVGALAESRAGTLWMADSGGALWTLDGRGAWKRHPEMKVPAIDLSAGPDDAIWAATEQGAIRLREGRAEAIPGAPLPGRAETLVATRDGRVWVATDTGAVHWARPGGDGWHAASIPGWKGGAFRCLAEDRRGRVWAGGYGGGLAFGTADAPWTVWGASNGPFGTGVMSILPDREGSVWFGMNAVGLAQWVGEEWSHRTSVDPAVPGPLPLSAFGVAPGQTPGSVLVAAFNAGVLRLGEGPERHYGKEEGLTEDVRAVVEPQPGVLWAGARSGLFESRDGKAFRRVLTLPGGFVMGFFRSPQGRWYAATTTEGAYENEGGEWRKAESINAGLDGKHVRGMTWLRNGELWVATLRGISVFRAGEEPVQLTSKLGPALLDSVNAVLEVSDDEVWAGGTGGIAVRRKGAWRRMTGADGLPGQTVYSLARGPGGAVWAGGSGGVGRYENGRFRTWDSRSGLLQEECNLNGLLVQPDGSCSSARWVGWPVSTRRSSLSRLPRCASPGARRRNAARTASRLSRPPSGPLHLRWSAPSLGTRPVQYRVRVPRLREAWSAPQSDDHLDVENLAAGRWSVEVEARLEGTDEWTAPLRLDVTVAPHWHETLLARAGLLALIGAALFGVVRLRMRALQRHAAVLEETVQERTALLRESEQQALAANRAKSTFLANMSHELRTPLNGVLGFAQLLARRKGRDAEDREGLDVILKSGEHLLGLINDVLSLSKIEAGRVTLEKAPFDLGAMVRDVEDVLELRAEAKDLLLTCEIDGARLPQAVTGDEGRLRQILINLLGNALKFTERGGVTLRVSWRDGRCLLEVEDTGAGIAAEELSRLFEPFVQTETGRRSKEGTGLGLALSRDLARLMDGDITAESTPGRGSCFRVDVALPEAPVEALPASREERRVTGLAPGQGAIRVLVVDDLPLNRAVLSRLLLSVGFEVREAASGEEALEVWNGWRPSLIWMDKRMPGIDGLEVTRRIRAAEREAGGTRVPILALSASALDHERGEILAAGCDDFVAKPFREETIFAKLREHLGVSFVSEAVERRAPTGRSGPEPAPLPGRKDTTRVLLVDDDWICREVAC